MAAQPVHRVTLAATAAALLALGLLFMIAPHQVGLILVAALLVASHLFDRRLPNMPLLIWTIRFVLYMTLILTSGIEDRGLRRLYLKPEYSNLFGYLCAFELAIQYWQHRDRRSPRGEALVLSGLIFAVATNTAERMYIQWLTPVFMGLLLLSMRGFRPRRPAIERAGTRWSVRTVRLLGIGLSFAVASGLIAGIRFYGNLIDNLTFQPLLYRTPNAGAGVSTEPFLGPSSDVPGSPLRVMRIDGLSGEAHLRGLAFDIYANNRWSPTYEQLDFVRVTRPELNGAAQGKRLIFTRWVDNLGLIYVPLNAAGIAPISGAPANWEPKMCALRAGLRIDPEYVYEMVVPPRPEHQGPLCPPITDEQRQRCLNVPPEIDKRVIELAQKAIAGIEEPARKAAAIAKFVEGNNTYSLEIRPPQGDRISDFILNKRPGHCQYFASAAVMMLRCAGIPARYTVGYYAHEPDGAQAIVVRARDAHAWAEAWIDGIGWITVDATPPAARPSQAFPPVSVWRKTWEWIVDTAAAFAEWAGGLTMTTFLTVVASLVGILILFQWLRILIKRRKTRGIQSTADAYACPSADLATLSARFEKLLKRQDIPCAPTVTWPQHVGSLSKAPASIDDLRTFVVLYTQARFRQHEDRSAVNELRSLLDKLESAATPAARSDS